MVARVPELRPIFDEHLGEDNELAPYMLFEIEFMHWFSEGVRHSEPDDPRRRFMDAVEALFARDFEGMDMAANLAYLGFIDTLIANDEPQVLERIRPYLGPATEAELARELARKAEAVRAERQTALDDEPKR
jgi:hypothetical protein